MSSQIGVGSSRAGDGLGAVGAPGNPRPGPHRHRGPRRRPSRDSSQPSRPTRRAGDGPSHRRPSDRRPSDRRRGRGRPGPRRPTQQRPGRGDRRRRLTLLGTLAAAVAALFSLLATPSATPTLAPGAPAETTQPPTGGAIDSRRQSQSDEELARYWTPARLVNAIDANVLTRTTGGESVGTGMPAGTAPGVGLTAGAPLAALEREPLADDVVTPYAGGGAAVRLDGALFTTINGSDYACSGSVVDSPGHDLVMTAGHCLHSGGLSGSFATNVIFIPGYSNGSAPYGVWHASQLTVTAGWGYQRSFDEDAGFATFRPVGGRNLQDVVGGAFPIAFTNGTTAGSLAGPQTVLGYPKLPPFDGATLMTCTGTTTPDPRGGHSLGLPCPMTAGASGGAWLSGFHNGTGTLDAVVSYAYSSDPNTIYGTSFGPSIRQLYQHAIQL
ncbi:trypsin-like serine peptidase [Pseudofrankia inefficax]|uniref:Signal peptide-containing protein n=1 Tax=Pseudofrankia inefficax (strain DSM 45817 / CECT 9037 / DDB 130130 / EuI1c) TaxID=298654 RepID=E3ITI5_PSEI1|nr:signal peptide-containing protein [Pseudofrankia inefficax]ADP78742.1 signal peptide-containing protein [Pseudofrankia inefficax]